MLTVSVIVPNYNHARFLEQRIESILRQTFQDFELILMDDASTDNSIDILKNYEKHPKVSCLVINKENSGSTFKQWNKGAGIARGKYIWIAESDDFAAPDFLEILVDKLKGNNNVGIAYCNSFKTDELGNIFGTISCLKRAFRWENDFTNSGKNEAIEFLNAGNSIPNASAVLFKKEAFEKAGGTDPQMYALGDWMLWVKILKDFDIYYSATPLNYFRFHKGNVRSDPEKRKNTFAEYITITTFILNNFPMSSKKAKDIRYHTLYRGVQYKSESRFLSKNFSILLKEIKKNNPHFFYHLLKAYFSYNKNKIIKFLQKK